MARRTTGIRLLLGAATALLLLFGAWWAQGEAGQARELRRTEILNLLAGEAAAARESLAGIVTDSRENRFAAPPFQVELLNAAYQTATVPPEPGAALREAERFEFAGQDPSAALARYERLLEGELAPADRVATLRHVARLGFAQGRTHEALDALREATRIQEAPQSERLLAHYELARRDDTESERLIADIEGGEFPGTPPARRAFIHEKLGGDPARVRALATAAQVLAADRPEDLVDLADGTAAWRIRLAGGWIELARVPIDDLLRALMEGFADGRWALAEGDGDTSGIASVALGSPFPELLLAPGPASIEELELRERSAFWSRFTMALIPAALLAAAALFMMVFDARAERLERSRQDFLRSITHEFKTPLANIMLYAETIRTHGGDDPDGAQGFAGTIDTEARRLLDLVQQALDVAAGGEGAFRGKERFDLRDAVREACDAYAARAADRNLELALELPDEPIHLTATRQLVIRAVSGVVDNAVAFAEKHVRVEAAATSGAAAVVIGDDGPGIPEADRERIFAPFVRLGDAATRAASGTGLGLSFVRRCVENDGGKVAAGQSELGGSAFTIEYPRS